MKATLTMTMLATAAAIGLILLVPAKPNAAYDYAKCNPTANACNFFDQPVCTPPTNGTCAQRREFKYIRICVISSNPEDACDPRAGGLQDCYRDGECVFAQVGTNSYCLEGDWEAVWQDAWACGN